MGVLSRKKTESSELDTTVDQQEVDYLASMATALVDSLLTKNVDPSLHTRIACQSMRNRMRFRILVGQNVEERLSMLQANNVTCVENSLWQQESCESSGPMEKKSLTLDQFRKKLWNQSRTAFMERKAKREAK